MKKFIIYFVIIVVVLVVGVYSLGRERKLERTEFLMDTIVNASIYVKNSRQGQEALNSTFKEMSRLEVMLDRHRSDSELAQINEASGVQAVTVSDETLYVIKRSLQIGEQTDGAFDITIAPLLSLWGFGTGNENVPEDTKLAAVKKLVDFRMVEVNEQDNMIYLREKEMEIDLGGIAKGYIVDNGAEVLIKNGVSSAFLNAGGDIRVIGGKPDGSDWRIGISHPRPQNSRHLIAEVKLRDRAIVTSGDYERFFLADNIRYHHIIDPKTGLPARGLISVTVIAPAAQTADALSTACFVLGLERGMALIEGDKNLEAIMVTEDEQVHVSSGLDGKVDVLP